MRSSAKGASTGEKTPAEPLEVMRRLISEVNGLSGQALEVNDQGLCVMESTEGMPMTLTLHDNSNSLLLTAMIAESEGPPSPEQMRKLLEINAYGADTLGGWLALIPDSAIAVFHFEWRPFQASDGETLSKLLNTFINHAHHLRDRVAEAV
ncbi:hypothetical protein GCM10023213_47170 [Prosthecobacter algae]|uniref:Tir chaperone family protein CesT n=1 Tax=Prosthecobacter algae TaxID=1144682 RepID=A0ABP9PUU9_9BACT